MLHACWTSSGTWAPPQTDSPKLLFVRTRKTQRPHRLAATKISHTGDQSLGECFTPGQMASQRAAAEPAGKAVDQEAGQAVGQEASQAAGRGSQPGCPPGRQRPVCGA